MSDSFNRIANQLEPDRYQCGCHWVRTIEHGNVLKQCPIHEAATLASVRKFDREKSARSKP